MAKGDSTTIFSVASTERVVAIKTIKTLMQRGPVAGYKYPMGSEVVPMF